MTTDNASEVQIRIRRLAAKELLRAARRYLTLVDDYRDWAAENGPEGPSTGKTLPFWNELLDAEATTRYSGTQRLRIRLDDLVAKVNRYEQSNASDREHRLNELAVAQAFYLNTAADEAKAVLNGTA